MQRTHALRTGSLLRVLWVGLMTWAWAAVCLGQIQAGVHLPADIQPASPYPGQQQGTGPVLVWSHALHHPGATYIAVHFMDFDLGEGDYLLVSDAAGGQSYTLTGRGKLDAGTFWSQHIKGDTALLQLIVAGPAGGPGFRIDEYVAGFLDLDHLPAQADEGKGDETPAGPREVEALCGADDKKNAVCYRDSHPAMYAQGRPVARLLIQGSVVCTGWLASPFNHLITARHCISTPAAALSTDYEFMAETPDCGTASCLLCHPGQVFSGGVMEQSDIAQDYALIRIAAGQPAVSYGYLRMTDRSPTVGEQIYIPQYPNGRAKQFAIQSTHSQDTGGVCRVFSVNEPACSGGLSFRDLGYYADTTGGCSGAPVLAAADHKVIALHHCPDCPNRGVPMPRICAQLPGNLCRPSAGTFWMSKAMYTCEDLVGIVLWDDDLSGQGTANVEATTLRGDQETVSLIESPAGSGIFTASLALAAGPALPGDGLLQVHAGDQLVLAYDDNDDGTGNPARVEHRAAIDCGAPTVSNLAVPIVHATGAVITFEVDEPATAQVRVGLECDDFIHVAAQSTPEQHHRFVFSDLQPETTYYFDLIVEDTTQNVTHADNQGQCYSFTTTVLPTDYFTETFAAGNNDLSHHAVMLVPDSSANGYRACTDEITSLPTSPEGGTLLGLADDGYALVTLDAGSTVRLYGENYAAFYVGANGYLTFGEGDGAHEESPEAHFRLPRISALFDDLNPGSGGTVSWKQGPDRMAVTWWAVPQYGQAGDNTFQVELFFDGRIRLSWLQLASPEGLAGLSAGLGVPSNFPPASDLGAYDCEPLPRIVQAVSFKTHGTGSEHGLELQPREDLCDVPVECRTQGPTRITVQFNQGIRRSTGTLDDVQLSAGMVTGLVEEDALLTVEMAGLPAVGRLGMTFPGITNLFDHSIAVRLCLGLLPGDVNQDCRVNILDLVGVRNHLEQPLTADNFFVDVTGDGNIDILDLVVTRNHLNSTILDIPCP